MVTASAQTRPIYGFYGFLSAIVAMVFVVLTMTSMFAPSQKQAGTSIGEIAAEIRNSAVRAVTGAEKPEPVVVQPSNREVITYYLSMIAPVLAGIGALLGAVALLRRETPQLAMMAIGLGVGAFVMQYAVFIALLIVGAIVLVAIINNIGDILGGLGT